MLLLKGKTGMRKKGKEAKSLWKRMTMVKRVGGDDNGEKKEGGEEDDGERR